MIIVCILESSFTHANLSYADLRGADLTETCFENTILEQAIFADDALDDSGNSLKSALSTRDTHPAPSIDQLSQARWNEISIHGKTYRR